jgi:hypothetical protein
MCKVAYELRLFLKCSVIEDEMNLTTLSLPQTVQVRMNNELESIYKEAVVAYFKLGFLL